MDNLFAKLPLPSAPDETVRQLLSQPGLRIERIVSTGQSSPPGFWYDQPEGEWVLLVQGAAALRFEDEHQVRHLKAGDHVDIAPHRRHRVDWTSPDRVTIWLAVYYDDAATAADSGPRRASEECFGRLSSAP